MREESTKMEMTTLDGLADWLDGLAKRVILIAPRAVGEQILYEPVPESSEIIFDFGKTDLPVKEYFLPSTHVLLSIEKGRAGVKLEEPSPDRKQVIFGLRPCDAKALRVLDALFLDEEPVDPYYARRREETTLIGLACRKLGEECFCTSLGSAPDDASDVDLMLTEMDGGYAIQAVTEKGQVLRRDLACKEIETTPSGSADGERTPILEPESWPERFEHKFWALLGDRCLSCRVCTYVCPTCRCFDVRDTETQAGSFERLRAWDSCMAENYRRIAGGHNPRPTKGERVRNRFYCKFCYYPRDFGPVACVGCGRCIAACPVNVDVVEMLEEVAAL